VLHLMPDGRVHPEFVESSRPEDVVVFGCAYSDFLHGDPRPELQEKGEKVGQHVVRIAGALRKWRDIHPMYTDPRYYHGNLRADNLHFFPMEKILKSDRCLGVQGRWFSHEEKTKDVAPVWKAAVRRWVTEGV
jgi:hypothetical protein